MPTEDTTRPRVAFAIEQTLGHLTHSDNLRRLLADSPAIELVAVPIPDDAFGKVANVPLLGNWTLRMSGKARQLLGSLQRRDPVDALFAHTQVVAVLLGRWMKLIPTVVSLDATPEQYDSLGAFYAHDVGPAVVERFKKRLNVRALANAEHVVTWSAWARDGVVGSYGVPPSKVTVIPPGVDVERWTPASGDRRNDGPMRVLFVGGDLARKGGDLLLAACRALRDDPAVGAFELHLVTRSEIAEEDGVVVHRLGPNSPELIELYHRCDVFCLPTLGDCLPMVLPEAGAAGLALISTDVGAIHEVVRDGETGLLVPAGDLGALTAALRTLLLDADLRARLAQAAGELVRSDHDAARNAARLADLLAAVARRRPARQPLLHRRRRR